MTPSAYDAAVPVDERGAALPGVLRIVVVCTGNICRSPMTERLMRDALRRRVGEDSRWVRVTSVGTAALVGHPMDPDAAAVLTGLGVHGAEDFVSRQLSEAVIADADLVLTAERHHRAVVVDLVPSAVRRTFTMRELDRLLAAVDPRLVAAGTPRERGVALADAATSMRGLVPYVEAHEDDIVDPYGRPLIEFERVASEVERALARPLDMLTGVRP